MSSTNTTTNVRVVEVPEPASVSWQVPPDQPTSHGGFYITLILLVLVSITFMSLLNSVQTPKDSAPKTPTTEEPSVDGEPAPDVPGSAPDTPEPPAPPPPDTPEPPTSPSPDTPEPPPDVPDVPVEPSTTTPPESPREPNKSEKNDSKKWIILVSVIGSILISISIGIFIKLRFLKTSIDRERLIRRDSFNFADYPMPDFDAGEKRIASGVEELRREIDRRQREKAAAEFRHLVEEAEREGRAPVIPLHLSKYRLDDYMDVRV